MKYFFDTEFIEGPQTKRILGIRTERILDVVTILMGLAGLFILYKDKTAAGLAFGIMIAGILLSLIKIKPTKNTIQLISIGIVDENNFSYYAISKEFNIKEAWYRYQIKQQRVSDNVTIDVKEYWIRDNVLRPIYNELVSSYNSSHPHISTITKFSYSNFKILVDYYGMTEAEIAKEIEESLHNEETYKIVSAEGEEVGSVMYYTSNNDMVEEFKAANPGYVETLHTEAEPISFYAYFADYDWVVFCWLFGRMIDLPSNFPQYCNDLKQIMEEVFIVNTEMVEVCDAIKDAHGKYPSLEDLKNVLSIDNIKRHPDFPKQPANKHNALADAIWNRELYRFIKKL